MDLWEAATLPPGFQYGELHLFDPTAPWFESVPPPEGGRESSR